MTHGSRTVAVPTQGRTPDHLRVFRDRMAEAGVRVRLPVDREAYTPPELEPLPGKPVSTIIVENRRRCE